MRGRGGRGRGDFGPRNDGGGARGGMMMRGIIYSPVKYNVHHQLILTSLHIL